MIRIWTHIHNSEFEYPDPGCHSIRDLPDPGPEHNADKETGGIEY
jgi:hypothetical protein